MDTQIKQLHSSWSQLLASEFQEPYMAQLFHFLEQQNLAGKVVYPPTNLIFSAFNITHFNNVKVVILGQDPYHGENQANGLSFSVPKDIKIPPSLKNIFKEIQKDLNLPIPNHGCLRQWAEQGVLLINATLTVEKSNPGSHQNKGWEKFTDKVIDILNVNTQGLVFMLWGGYAQKKGVRIDTNKHLILTSPHPSPLSAYRGYFGCGHFSLANRYLASQGQSAIDWKSL